MHPCYHIPELVVKGILNTLPFGKLHNRVVKGWQGKEGPDMPHLRLPTLHTALCTFLPKSTDFSKQALARLNRPVTSSLKKSLRIYAYFPSLPKRTAQIY